MFTIIPLEVDGEDVVSLSHKLWMIMFVGAFYGLIAGAIFTCVGAISSYWVSGVLAFLVIQWLNRFLHFDGLSDLGDGLVCTGTMEKKQMAMKDSHIGAGGMGYAIFFSLLTIAAYESIFAPGMFFFIPFAAEILSRLAMVACAWGGSTTKEGLGGIFVRNVTASAVVIAFVLALVFLGIGMLIPYPTGINPFAWTNMLDLVKNNTWLYALAGVMVVFGVLAVIIGRLTARVAMKNFGAVNGDILGATNEMARALILVFITMVIFCMNALLL
jgi:adenosylcobinamide-GDP ribazoletransferase